MTIPFNYWSKIRIKKGKKICTSRYRKYEDPRVYLILKLPLWVVKLFLYKEEGADSPEEFEKVWRYIHNGKFDSDSIVYVHFGHFNKGIL